MKRVVLVRPEGPRNVGMILRVCDNFGPCELVLVRPQRPAMLIHPEFEQMSHGVERVDEKLRVVETVEEALAGCTWAVGFTARVRDGLVREEWNEAAPRLRALAAGTDERLALVFGAESTGLSAGEAALCQELCHIRTAADHTSLNLAMCTGVVLQALFTGEAVHQSEPGGVTLSNEEREYLKRNLEYTFTEKVARSKEAARVIALSIQRVFGRAPLTTSDARSWHMMCRALGSEKTPLDFGLEPHARSRRERDVD
ncbi:MAG: RNA methyltransferase [Planctomycetes bacterium]|nr:RNA methyltransferase [Planctomycetota bacterium]